MALEVGWGVSVTPRPLFTPRKDPVPIAQEAGWAPGPVWTGAENLAHTGIRSPDGPARSQSLYRLSYPAHMKTNVHLRFHLAEFFLEWEIFRTKILGKNQNTYVIVNSSYSEYRGVYEMRRKNTVQPGRPQMTIRSMRFTCWITRATHPHSDHVITFPRQQWLR
jgi:hypothetical protein